MNWIHINNPELSGVFGGYHNQNTLTSDEKIHGIDCVLGDKNEMVMESCKNCWN
jgi:hypothetical protein